MFWIRNNPSVRITHIPTGISVSVTNCNSQNEAFKKAMMILKSKLYARKNGIIKKSEIVYKYNFPNNVDWADDIKDYAVKQALEDMDNE